MARRTGPPISVGPQFFTSKMIETLPTFANKSTCRFVRGVIPFAAQRSTIAFSKDQCCGSALSNAIGSFPRVLLSRETPSFIRLKTPPQSARPSAEPGVC